MDVVTLAGTVLLLGDNIKSFHDSIRDHLSDTGAITEWLDKADEQLAALLAIARDVVPTEGDDA